MADIAGFNIPFKMPSFGIGSGTIIWIVLIIFLLFVAIGIIYFMFSAKVYNRKIIVFENIAGQGLQVTYRDKARLVKLGDGGEELLFLKKKKVYRTAYGKKMGTNTYWFAVGQDGYWYNVVLGDIDVKMGMLDIEPIDRDMRYMHVAIRKNIQERYRKQNFMEKYGTILMAGVFVLIMIIGIWFLLDKIGGIASSTSGSIDAAVKVQETSKNIIASLDNLCTGGSGIKPAT